MVGFCQASIHMVGQEDIDLHQFLTQGVIKMLRKTGGRFSILLMNLLLVFNRIHIYDMGL